MAHSHLLVGTLKGVPAEHHQATLLTCLPAQPAEDERLGVLGGARLFATARSVWIGETWNVAAESLEGEGPPDLDTLGDAIGAGQIILLHTTTQRLPAIGRAVLAMALDRGIPVARWEVDETGRCWHLG